MPLPELGDRPNRNNNSRHYQSNNSSNDTMYVPSSLASNGSYQDRIRGKMQNTPRDRNNNSNSQKEPTIITLDNRGRIDLNITKEYKFFRPNTSRQSNNSSRMQDRLEDSLNNNEITTGRLRSARTPRNRDQNRDLVLYNRDAYTPTTTNLSDKSQHDFGSNKSDDNLDVQINNNRRKDSNTNVNRLFSRESFYNQNQNEVVTPRLRSSVLSRRVGGGGNQNSNDQNFGSNTRQGLRSRNESPNTNLESSLVFQDDLNGTQSRNPSPDYYPVPKPRRTAANIDLNKDNLTLNNNNSQTNEEQPDDFRIRSRQLTARQKPITPRVSYPMPVPNLRTSTNNNFSLNSNNNNGRNSLNGTAILLNKVDSSSMLDQEHLGNSRRAPSARRRIDPILSNNSNNNNNNNNNDSSSNKSEYNSRSLVYDPDKFNSNNNSRRSSLNHSWK
jgi:hypothetical protein